MTHLTPPPEHASHRWHWLDTPHGPMVASWYPALTVIEGAWDISGHMRYATDPRTLREWKYMGPAIPPKSKEQNS